MRLIAGLGLAWMLAGETFALSGTVRDSQGAAIAGATVSLVSDTSVRQTTGADGSFTIERPVSIGGRSAPGTADPNLSRIVLGGDRHPISIAVPAHGGVITLFSSDGRKRLERHLDPVEGMGRVGLPGLEPGIYFLRVAGNRQAAGRARALRSMSAGAAIDTLLAKKAGFVPVKSPVTSYDQAGLAIVLEPEGAGVSTLPPITNYDAAGPFAAVQESNVGPGGAYTVFRPDPLGRDGFVHSPLIFGYGINGEIRWAADFLNRIASHGIVVIACNKLTAGPGSAANLAAMTNGLNWLLQQNTTAGSKYQGKLAVTRAASMGYSVGATASVDVGAHAAIRTVVSIHGHSTAAALHGTLLLTTGSKDVDRNGVPYQDPTYANSKVQTFYGTVTGASHDLATGLHAHRPAATAWLRYWLYNDQGAKRFFYGDDCVMCKAPWENPRRKNWQ